MLDLAHEVLAVTGSSSTIVFRPLPADDPRQRKPDIHFAHDALGWMPTVQLAEGLRRSLPYFGSMLPVLEQFEARAASRAAA